MNSIQLRSFGTKSMEFVANALVDIFGYLLCVALVIAFAVLHPRAACQSVASFARPGLLLIKPSVNSVLQCFSYNRKDQDDLSLEAWIAGVAFIAAVAIIYLVRTELMVRGYMHYLSAQ